MVFNFYKVRKEGPGSPLLPQGVGTGGGPRRGSRGFGATPPHAAGAWLQVYTVVDEMFLAGEIRETSQTKVLKQLLMLQSLE